MQYIILKYRGIRIECMIIINNNLFYFWRHVIIRSIKLLKEGGAHTKLLTEKKKLAALFVTVAWTVELHFWRDLTNVVHISALNSTIRTMHTPRRKITIWRRKIAENMIHQMGVANYSPRGKIAHDMSWHERAYIGTGQRRDVAAR